MLRYFRDLDRFASFRTEELKDYRRFKNILTAFRSYYSLEQFSLKEIDKYLWQFGKEYFPKSYYSKTQKTRALYVVLTCAILHAWDALANKRCFTLSPFAGFRVKAFRKPQGREQCRSTTVIFCRFN